MNKRKKLFLEIILICVLLVLVSAIIYFTLRIKPSSESELKEYLRTMGEDFYVDFYYPQKMAGKNKDEGTKYLERYREIGIKVSLTGLSQYNLGKNDEIIKKFKNEYGEECDREKTKVIIYPKPPYTDKDYSIEPILECNFKK